MKSPQSLSGASVVLHNVTHVSDVTTQMLSAFTDPTPFHTSVSARAIPTSRLLGAGGYLSAAFTAFMTLTLLLPSFMPPDGTGA